MKHVLAMAAILIAFCSVILAQVYPGATNQERRQQSQQLPSVSIEQPQQPEPLILSHSSTISVPKDLRMVDVTFKVSRKSAKPIRAYNVHLEEIFEDQERNGGHPVKVMQDQRSPSIQLRQISFRCRANAKLRVWLTSVEFEDGTSWSSRF